MYDYLKGTIARHTPTYAVVDTPAGVGYMVNISLATYTWLQNSQGTVTLPVHLVVREDAWTLYGFSTERERELFRLLIGVSGVGPGTAMLILSALSTAQLEGVISQGDHKQLKAVKGIGAKTAERIIVDLRDKIKPSDPTLSLQALNGGAEACGEVYEEALAALLALGFARPQSAKVLKRLFDADPGLKVEQAIKQALSLL